MWLINTSSGRLKWFNNPTEVRYAILSHVWREEEQTFQALQALMREHDSPRDHTTDKIRKCCICAERDGYEWLWVDTCCINKDSSAELSEAINSMFAWYTHADVCYAFLDDVREDEDPRARGSSFWQSRWWERGWTLQELIAPKDLIFLDMSWVSIGTKTSLAEMVEDISGVDRGILIGELSLDEISVARRMSWASRRRTTRVEDRAYSLLGIFGVHLPTIYGEGGHAFIRLQEEIIKTIPDQSIFAWGPILDDYPLSCKGFATAGSVKYPGMESLLAPSPDVFVDAAEIFPIVIEKLSRMTHLLLENPSCSFTSYGCHVELPIIDCRLVPHLDLNAPVISPIALLACEDRRNRRPLALLFDLKPNAWNAHYVGQYCSIGPPVNVRGVTTSIDCTVHPSEISDTPSTNTDPEYHRIVSLVASLDHLEGLASVRKLYIHTSGHSHGLQPYRRSYSDVDYWKWNGVHAQWRKAATSLQLSNILAIANFLSSTVIAYITWLYVESSRDSIYLGTALLVSFVPLQLIIYFQSFERRPFPWLHLRPIPAFATIRLLNAPFIDMFTCCFWRFSDLVSLLSPFVLMLSLLGRGL